MRWLLVGVLCGVMGVGPAWAQEAPGAIVYRCGADFENLCRVALDGQPPVQLTSDGVAGGPLYASPSLSADGTKLAFTFGNLAYVGDADAGNRVQRSNMPVVQTALRPDGGRTATVEMLLEQGALPCPQVTAPGGQCRVGFYVFGVQLFSRGFIPYLFTYDAVKGGEKHTERRAPTTMAWWGSRRSTRACACS